jgi:bZIP transcription factor.
MHQSSSQQEFKSKLESTHETVSIIPAVPVQKDNNSKSNNPPPAATTTTTTPATTTNLNTAVGSVIRDTMNATTNPMPATMTNNATTGTGIRLGQKRSAATAFQESITHPSSSSFPNLLASSFHLPFQTTLTNLGTTGSSTGSDYSGNDESYTIAPKPQQSIACSNTTAITDVTCGLAAGTTATSAQIDLTPINRNGKNLTEKKIRRLEKNRLSARNCRRKKKEYTLNLQREIMMLEGENLRLRLQLQIGQEAGQSTIKEQEKVTEGIDECKWHVVENE